MLRAQFKLDAQWHRSRSMDAFDRLQETTGIASSELQVRNAAVSWLLRSDQCGLHLEQQIC